jgi:hypothetical protein
MSEPQEPIRRRWRYYRTMAGACPVREFFDALAPGDARVLRLAMALVRRESVVATRHLRGELYEVRAAVRGWYSATDPTARRRALEKRVEYG